MKKLLLIMLFIPVIAHAEFVTGNDLLEDLQSTETIKRVFVMGAARKAGTSLDVDLPITGCNFHSRLEVVPPHAHVSLSYVHARARPSIPALPLSIICFVILCLFVCR